MTTLAELEQLQAVNPVAAARLAQQILDEESDDGEEKSLTLYSPHRPHAKQQQFLDLDCSEALYGGAAGGGKSDALLMAALKYVHQPRYSAILFRRTFTELALPGAIMDRSHEWLRGTRAHWNGTEHCWKFPTDGAPSTLTFGYLDSATDHMRYQSSEFQFIGFDELTHFREKQYRYLFSRRRRLIGSDIPARSRGATNPGGAGHDWVKERFGIPDTVDFSLVYNSQGRVFVPASLRDNPSLDADDYLSALSELDATARAQLESGQWVRDTDGLVYREFDRSRNIVPQLPQLPAGESWKRILSCDFGVVDPTAFCELAFNRYVREVYVTRSEQWADRSPSEMAEEAIQWGKDCGGYEQVIGDVGGLGKAFEKEWMQRFRLPLTPAEKTSKLGFIKLINGDMRARKLLVLDGPNTDLTDNIGVLSWDDGATRENQDQPNHLTDALLYGWRASRHYAAKDAPSMPAYGSADWLKRQTDEEREKAFAATRKRVTKATRSLSDRQLIAKIARM